MIMRTTHLAAAIGLCLLLSSNTLAFSHPSSSSYSSSAFRYHHYHAGRNLVQQQQQEQQVGASQQQQHKSGNRRQTATTTKNNSNHNSPYSAYGNNNNQNQYGQQQYGKGPQARPPPQAPPTTPNAVGNFDYAVGILGDLHIDPRRLDEYITGRDQIYDALMLHVGAQHAIVSLGDLGETKNCGHNPSNPNELFSGTTQCHELAAEYLQSFQLPYEVITGNHGTYLRG
jgi:hypothetical protein